MIRAARDVVVGDHLQSTSSLFWRLGEVLRIFETLVYSLCASMTVRFFCRRQILFSACRSLYALITLML